MVLDPLGAQVIHRPGHLSGRYGEDVSGESSSYILNFNCFLFCCVILILSFTQEHFCLAEGVSKDMTDIVFNKATCKVIKSHQTCPPGIYCLAPLIGAEAADKAQPGA
jgi:hypothetical protein